MKTKRIYSYLSEADYKKFKKICEESVSTEIRTLIKKEIERCQKRKKK